jgi:hypothetical protein
MGRSKLEIRWPHASRETRCAVDHHLDASRAATMPSIQQERDLPYPYHLSGVPSRRKTNGRLSTFACTSPPSIISYRSDKRSSSLGHLRFGTERLGLHLSCLRPNPQATVKSSCDDACLMRSSVGPIHLIASVDTCYTTTRALANLNGKRPVVQPVQSKCKCKWVDAPRSVVLQK